MCWVASVWSVPGPQRYSGTVSVVVMAQASGLAPSPALPVAAAAVVVAVVPPPAALPVVAGASAALTTAAAAQMKCPLPSAMKC